MRKIDAAMRGDHGIGEAPQRGLVGDVAGKTALAGLFVDDADVRAVFAEFPGDALADALRAAGDHGHFVCKHAFASVPSRFLFYSPSPAAFPARRGKMA